MVLLVIDEDGNAFTALLNTLNPSIVAGDVGLRRDPLLGEAVEVATLDHLVAVRFDRNTPGVFGTMEPELIPTTGNNSLEGARTNFPKAPCAVILPFWCFINQEYALVVEACLPQMVDQTTSGSTCTGDNVIKLTLHRLPYLVVRSLGMVRLRLRQRDHLALPGLG
jgi:hypothetical protein